MRKEVLMRHTVLLGLVCGIAAGCSSPNDPFTTGDGYATVQGLVTGSSGAPLASTTVTIACAGTSPVATTTDASGVYLVNVGAPAASLNVRGNRLSCHFTEPDASTPRAKVDTELGFVQGPAMAALQTVDLHEQ
jgi:hypothetical protein